MVAENAFDHINEKHRPKIAADLLAHIDESTGKWDDAKFDTGNDYQRHLYALYLRLAGVGEAQVWARIFAISEEVSDAQRQVYTNQVIHSEIVGFPMKNGKLIPIPPQPKTLEAS